MISTHDDQFLTAFDYGVLEYCPVCEAEINSSGCDCGSFAPLPEEIPEEEL